MEETIKVWTLQGTCKKCGKDFTYQRKGKLTGHNRRKCDVCLLRPNGVRQNVISVEVIKS